LDKSVKIVLPNGKWIASNKKEVKKHLTRAVIKACKENDMPRKANSLKPFMKEHDVPKPRQKIVREVFFDIPSAKRRKNHDKNVQKITKKLEKVVKLEDVEEVIPKKKGGWTKEEDEKILTHGKGVEKWRLLSLPGRIPRQCRNRYQKLTGGSIKRGGWTKEEDAIILEHKGDWKLSQRNANQCKNRCRKLPEKETPIKRGGWTKVEDEKILQCGNKIEDGNWSSLACTLPNRTCKQCSNRFKKLTEKRGIKRGGWTKEEDEKIIHHGKSVCDKDWSFLAEQFPDRNAKQCNNRFKKLSDRRLSGAVTNKKIKEEEDRD